MIAKYNSQEDGVYFDRNLTDILKLLCCIMVALHHYSQYVLSNDISHNLIYQIFSTQGGYLGVGIFFFLSGFGLIKSDLHNHLSFLPYLKKRLIKVYLPVLLVSVIWLPIKCYAFGEPISIFKVIGLIWYWHDGVLWFVRTIIVLYLIFYLYSYTRLKTKGLPQRMIVCLIYFLISLTYALVMKSNYTISIPLFFFGVAVGEFESLRKVFKSWYIQGCLFTFVAFLCYLGRHDTLAIHGLFNYFVLFAMLWVCSMWKIACPSTPKYISSTSFDVYLVHNKVLIISKNLLTVVPVWEFVVVTFIATLLFYNLRTFLKI